MLSCEEKIKILKNVPIFAGTDKQVLYQLANVVQEHILETGQEIIHKHDSGDCLFIIYKGKAKIHENEHTIAEVGENSTIGEHALLSPSKRTASVTTLVKTHVLSLDRVSFYSIAGTRTEVLQAIIQVLVSRLREQNSRIIQNMRNREQDLIALVEKRTAQIKRKNLQLENQKEEIKTQNQELERQKQALGQSKEDLEIALSKLQAQNMALNQSAIFAMTDLKGDIIHVNDKLCQTSKYPREELIGQNQRILNSGYHSKEFWREMWKTIGTGQVWRNEVCNKAKDGSLYWVDTAIVPVLDDKNKPYQYLSIRFEVTERKKAEQLVGKQNRKLAERQAKITSSITYARRIQNAFLGQAKSITQNFQDAFILFEPKDIVSGDFYWYEEIEDPFFSDNICPKLIIAADCTGHGVPGAFMTALGNAFLEEIVVARKIYNPGKILQELDQKILQAFAGKSTNKRIDDGMDMGIILLDETNNKLYFAGAKNPLWYVRNQQLNELKPSKFPIGSYQYTAEKKFHTHIMNIKKGDALYLFSDGFQDQFGGKHNRKYLKKKFRQFLLSISYLPMEQQQEKLRKEFLTWKGEKDQTDDVLIIGIKV